MYQNLVESISYSYTHPSDSRAPTKFPIQSFLSCTFPNLTSIRLTGSPQWLNNLLISQLAGSKRLRKCLTCFSLSGAKLVDEDGMKHILKFSSLELLELENCIGVCDTLLQSLGKSKIEVVNIGYCSKITVKGVESLLKGRLLKCDGGLKELDVSGCLLGDELFKVFVDINEMKIKPTIRLRSLTISNMRKLSIAGISNILNTKELLPELRSLNISNFSDLNDETVVDICKTFGRTLQKLVLQDCQELTMCGVVAGIELCTRLSEIDISGCGISSGSNDAYYTSQFNDVDLVTNKLQSNNIGNPFKKACHIPTIYFNYGQ